MRQHIIKLVPFAMIFEVFKNSKSFADRFSFLNSTETCLYCKAFGLSVSSGVPFAMQIGQHCIIILREAGPLSIWINFQIKQLIIPKQLFFLELWYSVILQHKSSVLVSISQQTAKAQSFKACVRYFLSRLYFFTK